MDWKKIAITVGKWGGGLLLAGVAAGATDYVKARTKQALDSTLGKPIDEKKEPEEK